MRSIVRHNDTMIAVETAPAEVAFADILEATTVATDDHESEAPWDSCDGFEHTATPERQYDGEADTDSMQGTVYCDGRRERVIIELPQGEDYGTFEYMRARGASRQVAAEAVAANRRRTLSQLVAWYGDGWQWFGVKCCVSILGECFEQSLWGIDSSDYAETLREEIALEVAAQLEQAGFTVTGKPEPPKRLHAKHFGTVVSVNGSRREFYQRAMTRESWRAEYARNLASQNWRD